MTEPSDVDFGVKLPIGGDKRPEDYRRLTQAAEAYGFDTVWLGEHLVYPEGVDEEYPYTDSGESPFDVTQNAYDVFQMLAHLAGITEDIRLGSNICIVPLRHPVIVAKHALTLDVLSDGRFEFGVGPGWMRSEFDALGVPYEERGPRTDEFLELFTRVSEDDVVEFDGKFHTVPPTGFRPRPVQSGGPPIWVGGDSGATFRRIGEYGDGWAATNVEPDELADGRNRAMHAWRDFDRAGEPLVAIKQSAHVGSSPAGFTPRLVGDPDSIVADVVAYVEAGADLILPDFRRTDEPPVRRYSVDEQIEQIERFGSEVIPMLS